MAARLLSIAVAAIVGLLIVPASVILIASGCSRMGMPLAYARIADIAALTLSMGLICGYVPGIIRRLLRGMRRRMPAPVYRFVEWGATGALLVGGAIFMIILIFGRTRPDGWNYDLAWSLSGAAFAICGWAGFRDGARR
jgi:hypothetical protein